MWRKNLVLLLCLGALSCGVVKKRTTYGAGRTITVEPDEALTEVLRDSITTDSTEAALDPDIISHNKSEQIIQTALTYAGVKYKYGGTTRKGMDCSGLMYVTFQEYDIYLPRVSFYMANEGRKIPLEEVSKGDLLFFTTSDRRKRINHVGLVVEVDGDDIKFIHSTISRGVIVSSLKEGYWNYAFVKATRIL
ncbi:NlpC/P60 family protein [Muriicola jejuensis]|uniref:NlpC/P60 family protein n=1 Tax=Muriicola jejuensis TaxID=504488 RepID=A0A6P0UF57_9FLAO|nr:C40 family peptidase [Muriicola jejuensis]NER11647.1 NlpC/P60 family protein [Muriicola jejuensis]SMP25717.1 NlpC/P60 family protein [Muriicola jejuensis]